MARGDAVVFTAEEMIKVVEQNGVETAAQEVDVVTTGTFGAMCSSGAFFNFGHADPPTKLNKVFLNDVEAYHGNAAVDCYIGVTQMSRTRPFEYGGGHVIEDLLKGKTIHLEATFNPTDCYPGQLIDTEITIDDLNQAILCNPRNAYQRYTCATNSAGSTLYTYMGKLLPNLQNAIYSGSGCLSPLDNDPSYQTIGIGTRIFLGGGIGYIIGEGTQHNPSQRLGTIMVKGDLKQMDAKYLQGAAFTKYGTSMYVGLGIPIPILNTDLARTTGMSDEKITTNVADYGKPRNKPTLREVSYAELKSGKIEINGKTVKTSSISSLKDAREIAATLKEWIEQGTFFLTQYVERLSTERVFKPMKLTKKEPLVKDVMKSAATCNLADSLQDVAKKIIEQNVNHIVVVDAHNHLIGIVTSYDLAKAVASNRHELANVVTKKVIVAYPEQSIGEVARTLEIHDISAAPVVNLENEVQGIITSEDISKIVGKVWR
nr:homocysteine biosynthesis protein [Candidatus Borrarchaeum sp.]